MTHFQLSYGCLSFYHFAEEQESSNYSSNMGKTGSKQSTRSDTTRGDNVKTNNDEGHVSDTDKLDYPWYWQ